MPKTELRSEVEIDAPLAHVFGVLTDFARYHEWNPFITPVAGKLVVGEKLVVEVSLPEGDFRTLKPTIVAVADFRELRFRRHYLLPSLLAGEFFFRLSARSEGVTRVAAGQDFSGLLLRFSTHTLSLAARGFVYMNQALKRRAEATRPTSA